MRLVPWGDGGSEPFRAAMIDELEQAGLRRGDFLANEVPGMIWKEDPRDVLIKPQDVAEVRIEPDELNPGSVRATLKFSLGRGAYATMLIKRLFAPSWYSRSPDEEARHDAPRERPTGTGGPRRRLDADFGGDEDQS